MKILRRCKRTIVNAIRHLSPETATIIESHLQRRHIRRFEKSIGVDKLVERFLRANDCVIHSGPFKGMKYIERASGSALLPKLLGTYERELNLAIEEAISRSPSLILDVGCAEGYYAMGLARRLPNANVVAFDIDSHARMACKELARANDVGTRVSVLGRCDHNELRTRIKPFTLLICDCEGFEWHLLDAAQVPSLAGADMLVELHGKSAEECMLEIRNRLGETHELQFIAAESRTGIPNAAIQSWSNQDQNLAANEFRIDGHLWVWAKTKSWV